MNRIVLSLFFVLCFTVVKGQDKPLNIKAPRTLDPSINDTLSRGRTQRSTSNIRLKNLDARIQDYKIITRENDTTFLDTSLTVFKDYKFNYLRKDNFDVLPFLNLGQTYNTLSYDFSGTDLVPRFGARARHFNYMEEEDIKYYYVPTPLTELTYKTAFEQGQLLDAFFTVNTSRQFNFSVAYKGLRSLGKYQHSLTSTGNLRVTTNFKTKNKKYNARAHIATQDLLNEENGGLRDEDLINFESGNPEFIDRSVFDPRFENAESILEGKRLYFEHDYKLVQRKDSVSHNILKVGNLISFTNKYYEFRQDSQNDFFGDAFENTIHERTTLEDFYAEANVSYSNNIIGNLTARLGYNNFNYGYDRLVQVNGETITNRIKGDAISAGGAYENTFGKFNIKGKFGILVSGDLTGNYFQGNAQYIYSDDISVSARLHLNSRAPNYNYLLYQSDYINYNWETNFDNVETKQLAFRFKSQKIADVEFDYNTITNYAFFTQDVDLNVKPIQISKPINYFRVKIGKELSYRNFHLMNTIRYQAVIDGEGVLNVPEIVTRNTLYYANHLFKKALYLQTGITFSYFTKYNMNAYDPVLAEFYVQNNSELGGFPRLDFFINAKVRQTRIFLKAEHFNSSFTGYNFYSAPNYPYRDFTVRFGLVWNFFL